VTAASGLRHCDINDLSLYKQSSGRRTQVERPSNRSRIVVVTAA